ncbi:gluconate 2-dehydrogenase subunit 3 family protein [Nocardioides aurantiacus]|uniref:Gluconate 2-dehydrogenase subunit 3-like protein n=1 Tax=Nocardioides aurantiacus TaxID=86796 RepID=A0A3N2CUI5_9ACTN|nr:gluconate 2-dehydrogenase subunit 3 family protein [Nocardioides aurantiacus]ROR91205.1 gluconate 2-dehydrogenase subunit 3-like protein [Nocardioides aurantiacus]
MVDTTPDTVSPAARTNLVRLLRAAYPHPRFPDGPYERTADTIIEQVDESLWHRLALVQGLESLDAAAQHSRGTGFADLDDEQALALLRGIEDAQFFAFVRGVTVVTLYNDHEVWDLLGYEGESYSKGGYLHRGFDDLDWLPNPRIEEYDGPERIVEVAPDDQLTTTGGTH